ncbi:hypothetical protein GCM10017688_50540 [Streptomyces ramulosus]
MLVPAERPLLLLAPPEESAHAAGRTRSRSRENTFTPVRHRLPGPHPYDARSLRLTPYDTRKLPRAGPYVPFPATAFSATAFRPLTFRQGPCHFPARGIPYAPVSRPPLHPAPEHRHPAFSTTHRPPTRHHVEKERDRLNYIAHQAS